jgi:NADPH-dependent 7-cyano-7-deazaguanine reductase QueF
MPTHTHSTKYMATMHESALNAAIKDMMDYLKPRCLLRV